MRRANVRVKPVQTPELDALARAESLIAMIPDYPQPGILFRDIMPLLADAAALRAAAMVEGVGLIPIRKAGKLPRPAASVSYALEYGTAEIEAHDDLRHGARVLLLDDVLATGGTIAAARELVEKLGGSVAGTAILLELDGLGGRDIAGSDIHAVFHA